MGRKEINSRKIFIIGIISICIICINVSVFLTIVAKDDNNMNEVIVDTVALSENFSNIFDNKLNSQGYNISMINKVDTTKDLIHTNYNAIEKVEGRYDINASIPNININTSKIQNINKEIEEIFYSKINDILLQTSDVETIYSVKYKAYINDNILSLIIISNLKEGDNPQRLIIKTYNYNISSNEELNINQLLDYRFLTSKDVQSKIDDVIQEAAKTAATYQELGYNKYLRNTEDEIYKVENSQVFFLGAGKSLYIIYPYGNTNYTSEYDLVVL